METIRKEILESRFSEFKKTLKALNRRARRAGLPEAGYVEVDRYIGKNVIAREEQDPYSEFGKIVRYFDAKVVAVDIDLVEVKLPGDWAFSGRIEHHDGVNLISTIGEADLEAFRTAKNTCDHCGTVRRRKSTYIVDNADGDRKRVGKTCLRDFLGTDSTDNVASRAEFLFIQQETWAGDWLEPSEGYEGLETLSEFLPKVAAAVRLTNSFTSTNAERSSYDPIVATWRIAKDAQNYNLTLDVNDDDRKFAADSLEWLQQQDATDYFNNLRALVEIQLLSETVHFGLAASLIGTYTNHLERVKTDAVRAERAAKSEWLGSIGERIEHDAEVIFAKHLGYSDWGERWINKFLTTDGQTLVWFTGRGLDRGLKVRVRGTVKDHSEFRDEKSTVITRAKVEVYDD